MLNILKYTDVTDIDINITGVKSPKFTTRVS